MCKLQWEWVSKHVGLGGHWLKLGGGMEWQQTVGCVAPHISLLQSPCYSHYEQSPVCHSGDSWLGQSLFPMKDTGSLSLEKHQLTKMQPQIFGNGSLEFTVGEWTSALASNGTSNLREN